MACEMNRKQKHIQQIDRRKVLSYNSYQWLENFTYAKEKDQSNLICI